jgi:DNA polymerase-3 subunit gamma/tau
VTFDGGRKETWDTLKGQLLGGTLPQAVLFSGPAFSGRMSMILECVRVLSCHKEGSDECACPSCKQFAYSTFTNVVAIGNRDYWVRIDAAIANMLRLKTELSLKQLYRELRMMLLQYHPALLEQADTKEHSLFEAAGALDEELLQTEIHSEQQYHMLAKTIASLTKPLRQVRRRSQVSIDQVRALQQWVGQTSLTSSPRFIILEGMEQSTEGSRNSLLKMLEEPAQKTYIMLLSEHPSRLLPTILSRTQHHRIKPFSKEEKNKLLSTLFFVDPEPYPTVEHFIVSQAGIDTAQLQTLAEQFIRSLDPQQHLNRGQLEEMGSALEEDRSLKWFLNALALATKERLNTDHLPIYRVQNIMSVMQKASFEATIFNQNNRLFVESLYYRLLEVV